MTLKSALVFAFIIAAADRGVQAKPIQSFQDCRGDCPVMIVVDPGSFEMGTAPGEEDREKLPQQYHLHSVPQHAVSIKRAFALAQYDVTHREFAAFIDATGYKTGSGCMVVSERAQWENRPELDWRNPGFPQSDRDPVVCVSWNDAKAYTNWLSKKTNVTYRLPTEAEWEFAARAGARSARYWGDDSAEICRHANIADKTFAEAKKDLPTNPTAQTGCADGYVYTAPVGSFPANAFGIYDMLGNVWQWTEDCWNTDYKGAPADGSAWMTGDCGQHVKRGGSWYSASNMVRAANRDSDEPTFRSPFFGFRVARDLGRNDSPLTQKP